MGARMAKPAWSSMRLNYRSMYRRQYNSDWPGNDDQLDKLIELVGVLASPKEQDETTIEEMRCYALAGPYQ